MVIILICIAHCACISLCSPHPPCTHVHAIWLVRLAPAGLALQPGRMCHTTRMHGHVTARSVFVYVMGGIPYTVETVTPASVEIQG